MKTIKSAASLRRWVRIWKASVQLSGLCALGLAGFLPQAHATTYDAFGGTKPYWPSANQWLVLPGLVTSTTNAALSGRLARLDFLGDATYPTAYYSYDANYVYFRVRVNAADPAYPSSQWTDTIFLLIDSNGDSVPDYGVSWDTKGSGSDHQLELNVPDPASPNYTTTRWNRVNMIDRDGDSSKKLAPDFNTLPGHTDDGYLRLVSQQAGPAGAGTATFLDFAVKWAYLTGTYNSNPISLLAPGQTWRVQFGSIRDDTDHVNLNADVAGSATLSTTLGTAGAWSDSITPLARNVCTWTGTAAPDANWSTAGNWEGSLTPVSGADLIFPAGPSSKSPINDLSSGTLSSINSATLADSGYDVTSSSGTTLTITNGFVNSSSSGVANWRVKLSLGKSQTFSTTTASASTAFFGTWNLNNYTLTIDGAGNLDNTAVISGTGGIVKNGAGTLSLANLGNNTYTGKTTVNAGTLFIIQESNLGADPLSPAADQLKLDGGTLNASASFAIDDSNRGLTLASGGGTFAIDEEMTLTIARPITGPGSLTKTSLGTLALTGTHTFTGPTLVSEGRLNVDGALSALSTVTVAPGATFGGGPDAGGSFSIGGTLAPGNGVGVLHTGSETWNSDGSLEIELSDATGAEGSAPGWDFLDVNGSLTIASESGTPFVIRLVSLSGGSAGPAENFDNSLAYSWRIVTASGGISGFSVDQVVVDDSGFSNDKGEGRFALYTSGNDLYLQFVPPLAAAPVALGRAAGTYLRIPVASVLAQTAGGTAPRALQSVTSRDGDFVQVVGSEILFAPTVNATRILDYVVADSSMPTPQTASSTITISVTNAVSAVNAISSTGQGVSITFAGLPGYRYAVERSSDLETWTTVQTLQAPPAGVWTFVDSSPPNPSYYRLRQDN